MSSGSDTHSPTTMSATKRMRNAGLHTVRGACDRTGQTATLTRTGISDDVVHLTCDGCGGVHLRTFAQVETAHEQGVAR